MQSLAAYIAVLSWPLVTVFLFLRMPPGRAIVTTVVAGMLLLPASFGIDLPLFPALSRNTAPMWSALLCCVFAIGGARQSSGRGAGAQDSSQPLPGWLPKSPILLLLLLVLVTQPWITAALNGTPAVYGPRVLPALKLYDGLVTMVGAVSTVLPILLGRRYLARSEDHAMVLRILVFALLLYTVPILIELRLSPQIHRWVYGYFPTDFIQAIRGGGYRPMVLLGHGLTLTLLLALSIIAASALLRDAAPPDRRKGWTKLGWLGLILALCNSFGALLLAAFATPVALFAKRSMQITIAAALAAMVLLYPLARAYDVFPADRIVSMIGGDRGGSLQYRFANEDILLDKALQKPLFGWGGWARNRVFDPVFGWDLSVTDGSWVIALGTGGLAGFIAVFGLLAAPVMMLWRYRNRPDLGPATAGLALMLAINLVDLLPNSSMWPLTWLVAGMLVGRAELLQAERLAAVAQRRETPRRGLPAAQAPVAAQTAAVRTARGRPGPEPRQPSPEPRQPSPEPRQPSPEPRRSSPEPERPARGAPVRPGLGGAAGRRGSPPTRRK